MARRKDSAGGGAGRDAASGRRAERTHRTGWEGLVHFANLMERIGNGEVPTVGTGGELVYRRASVKLPGKLQKFRRGLAEVELAVLGFEYDLAPNPLYAWRAVQIAKETGQDVPPWAATYLARSADRLLRDVERAKPGAEAAPIVSRALQFTVGKGQGRGSVLVQYQHAIRRIWAVEEACSWLSGLRSSVSVKTKSQVWKAVAAATNGRFPDLPPVKPATVRRWHQELSERVEF